MIISSYATKFTLTGERDYQNRKPYRTPQQLRDARKSAYRDDRGVWHSPTPVSYHKAEKQ